MHRSLLCTVAAAAALAGLAACANDAAVAPGAATDAEVVAASRQDAGEDAAATVGELTANEIESGASAALVAPGGHVAADFAIDCSGPDGSGWFSCTAVTEGGLTVLRQIRFWEGTNYGLAWDSAKTDSVNHHWSVTGSLNSVARPGKVWTINDMADATMLVLRGVVPLPPQHSWSGTSDRIQSSTYTVNSVERDFTHTAHDTVSAVLFQIPRSANPFPLSGSITRHVTSVFTAGSFMRTVTRRIVVTFNGTNIARLQDGGVTCDLDLTTRVVSNCH